MQAFLCRLYEVPISLYKITPKRRFCKKSISWCHFITKIDYFIHSSSKTIAPVENHLYLCRTPKHTMAKHLIISTATELVRILPQHIVYFSSDGNYTTMMQIDGETRVLTSLLGNIEKRIEKQLGSEGKMFVRLGKSLIINSSYIYYINPAKQKLKLSDAATFCHELPASKEALRQLKELIEKEAE